MAESNPQEAALLTLMDAVYVPRFVEKCASLGLQLETQEQVSRALSMAAHINMQLMEKSAQSSHSTDNLLKLAENALARTGWTPEADEPEINFANVPEDVRKAAAALAAQ